VRHALGRLSTQGQMCTPVSLLVVLHGACDVAGNGDGALSRETDSCSGKTDEAKTRALVKGRLAVGCGL
jgi:hypothetical protein